MLEIRRQDAGFVAVVSIPVDGPDQQHGLVDLLASDVEEWVRFAPGFVSANYHASLDGTRVLNYAQWLTEKAYRDSFRDNPRTGALREAVVKLTGGRGPEMAGYTLLRSIQAAVAKE